MRDPAPSVVRARPGSRRRRILFPVLAVLLGFAPLLASELALRALGVGKPDPEVDPFVGFAAIRPLFVLDETSTRYVVEPSRLLCFRPQSFPADKAPGTFRIFCLGGSTVQGRPFAVETSFTTWLRLSLQAADPSRRWEVINCGGVSYASYRLVPILDEVLGYDPDLILLCTGHNEFLENRTYPRLSRLPGPVRAMVGTVAGLRTFTALRQAVERVAGRPADRIDQDRPILPAEVDALLDYKGGLEEYHRDEAWRTGVVEHYRVNLQRMLSMADAAGVPLLLMNPVANLETPPFKAEHRPDLTPEERRAFEAHWDAARELFGSNLSAAVGHLRRAVAIDDEHAGIWYTLGICNKSLGRLDEARRALERARDLDVCPLRIPGPMQDLIQRLADDSGTPLVDLQRLFAARSRGGITGNDLLVDHVHPSISGHQGIARALLDAMVESGWVPAPQPGWEATRDRLYAENLASLDDFYYVKGQQRLRNLNVWARGRATRLRSMGPVATGLPNPPIVPER